MANKIAVHWTANALNLCLFLNSFRVVASRTKEPSAVTRGTGYVILRAILDCPLPFAARARNWPSSTFTNVAVHVCMDHYYITRPR